jgi:hypothetical protein
MKPIKTSLAAILILASLAASLPAAAGGNGHGRVFGGRVGFGLGVGLGVVVAAPLFWPGYYAPYYSPYYAYAPYAYPVNYAPVTQYVQTTPVQPAAVSSWYYCAGSKTYYPYVQQCPGGWQQVAPTPPPAN